MANEQNLKSLGSRPIEERREIARKGANASNRKQREKKTLAESLRVILNEPVSKGSRQTRQDAIAIKLLQRMFEKPTMKDAKLLAEILGEVKQTINAEGMTINISSSDTGKDNIEKLLAGE